MAAKLLIVLGCALAALGVYLFGTKLRPGGGTGAGVSDWWLAIFSVGIAVAMLGIFLELRRKS
jgi:hypothetical protein